MTNLQALKRRNFPEPPPPTAISTNLAAPETAPAAPEAAPKQKAGQGAASKIDGRTLRATGRTIAITLRVSPEFNDKLREIAQRDRILLVEVLERALATYKSK